MARRGTPLPVAVKQEIRDRSRKGESPTIIARALGLSRVSVYKFCANMENPGGESPIKHRKWSSAWLDQKREHDLAELLNGSTPDGLGLAEEIREIALASRTYPIPTGRPEEYGRAVVSIDGGVIRRGHLPLDDDDGYWGFCGVCRLAVHDG